MNTLDNYRLRHTMHKKKSTECDDLNILGHHKSGAMMSQQKTYNNYCSCDIVQHSINHSIVVWSRSLLLDHILSLSVLLRGTLNKHFLPWFHPNHTYTC